MREKKLSERRVERESVDAASRRVHEHRARPVDDVTGGDLIAALLQAVFEATVDARHLLPVNREDGPDGHVDADVAGTVERVVQQHVFPAAPVVTDLDRNRMLFFFRRDHAYPPGVLDAVAYGVVREYVELLLNLPLHVDRPPLEFAEDVGQSGAAHLPRNDLRGEAQVV